MLGKAKQAMTNLKRRLSQLHPTNIITKALKRARRRKPKPQKQPPPPPPPPPTMSPPLFPPNPTGTDSTILPTTTLFQSTLHPPFPTNSFFQNFTLSTTPQPEYIHPYHLQPTPTSLSISLPSPHPSPAFILQPFVPDLSLSAPGVGIGGGGGGGLSSFLISAFDDLSLTIDFPPSLRFHVVRGSPFVTCETLAPTRVEIRSQHGVVAVESDRTGMKHRVRFGNGAVYVSYVSVATRFVVVEDGFGKKVVSEDGFCGVVRVARVFGDDQERVLDRFSTCYPVSGKAEFTSPFCMEYRWEKRGWGELLLLAHPLHLKLLGRDVTVLQDFKYNSIDGELVGVVGDRWRLQTDPISITWHSIGGVREEGRNEIISAICDDVEKLSSNPITTNSSYFYGKAIARAARLAVIAEEVGFLDVISKVRDFLKGSITPWLDGTFEVNGFFYDPKWGGIVTKQGSIDKGADFGFGIYNDHHYHIGYFLYAIAVLAKIDHAWGRKYKPKAYALVADFMTLSHRHPNYTRLRCFDLWKLHSWAGGLTEFADGRNQESSSEAVNAYYSAGLLGLAYGDTHLLSLASTLTALEMRSAETWWHVREGEGMYDEEFCRQNKVIGVLWNNKRDSGLWFAPPDWKECRLGIQLLPLLPITEVLFRDVGFAKALVEWAMPSLGRDGCGEGWKGFVYALEGVFDRERALSKTKMLTGHDDGNSLSNLLWWLYSRGDSEDNFGQCCSFAHYCH